MFLFDRPAYWLFYTTALITALELIEEIIIVFFLREWKTNVRGLYWVLRWKESL
jgi:CDP-diacylglycerol--glycerol-3-phosphate 3-phosphatidyltransferase